MPEDARSVANFFLEIAWSREKEISHLQLQKILFFAHAWHLGKYNEPLLGQRFEAWRHGPVIRVIYDQLKRFKSSSVIEKLKKIDVLSGEMIDAHADFTADKIAFLTNLFDYYYSFHPYQLVSLTHEKGGPWEKIWEKAGEGVVPGMLIPDESIRLWILRREEAEAKYLTN
ncbi:Panacea domain-containing protein [Rhizobium sp. BR 362]|uniref:Panacea domain-containing protein n=1 Tax=Rhizobium sp. BR 362 TaxID=3040670 RepID=UPI002F3E919A